MMEQASLLINLGGIGIQSLVDLSLPTFLSSCTGVLPLVSIILNNSVDNLALSSLTERKQEWETRNEEIPSNTKLQHQ